ncbi:MAG TPA: patatin-like phospholipase family protein [Methylomirabilota bacterium]|jgi:predicted acylesterase/phospholipase RssA
MIGARDAVALFCLALLTGCASARAIPVARADGVLSCQMAAPERDLLLGVALSGGGSRAALFGAAVLEALTRVRTADGASLTEKISHVSSVSGGSIAATYYVLKKPGQGVNVLNGDGSLSDAYRTFFEQYRADVSQDFETSLIWRQLLSFRWINSALAATTLSEIFQQRLFDDARLQDVIAREKAGDSPGLIINTTLYNNGRRLAITALPSDAFEYDFFADLERSLRARGKEMEAAPYIRERWKLLRPMTPLDIHMNPCAGRLAGVVTASASFPPLVGPITLQVGGEKTYWHAGDGGLYENQGIESLLFLYLKQMQAKRVKRALIIAVDSSYPFSVGERKLGLRSLPFTLLTFDFSRIPSIMEERATTYQALFFRTLQIEGVFPDSKSLALIQIRHTDAQWAADMSDLPPACKAEPTPLASPVAVKERIAEIPTALALPSECDRQLLVTAADKLVGAYRDTILEFLNRP